MGVLAHDRRGSSSGLPVGPRCARALIRLQVPVHTTLSNAHSVPFAPRNDRGVPMHARLNLSTLTRSSRERLNRMRYELADHSPVGRCDDPGQRKSHLILASTFSKAPSVRAHLLALSAERLARQTRCFPSWTHHRRLSDLAASPAGSDTCTGESSASATPSEDRGHCRGRRYQSATRSRPQPTTPGRRTARSTPRLAAPKAVSPPASSSAELMPWIPPGAGGDSRHRTVRRLVPRRRKPAYKGS